VIENYFMAKTINETVTYSYSKMLRITIYSRSTLNSFKKKFMILISYERIETFFNLRKTKTNRKKN
jgi:hypothetical protein